jgi:nucleotide-binding universal stress UspA family protein
MDIDRWIARWEGEGGAIPQTARPNKRSSRGDSKAIMLRQILVPIDFSPESLKTLRYAKLLSKRFGAELHLVHVVTPPVASLPRHASWLTFSKEVAANARKRLAELAAESSLPARPKPYSVRMGKIADEINEVARVRNVGLIAIATRGYTGLKHAFLGSTTEQVVRNAPCPVLVVREKKAASAKERARRGRTPLQFRKILVPVDFSENSRLGLEYGMRFAREFRASLVVFHSVFVTSYVLGDEYTAREVPNLIAIQQDYAKEEMEKLREEVSGNGCEIETEIAFGSPVEQISDYVTKQDVDLIVTSTHGRSGLSRVFIGSTAERIVRHAPCPVLVVPNRAPRKSAR